MLTLASCSAGPKRPVQKPQKPQTTITPPDTAAIALADELGADFMPDILTEEDYVDAARRLGVEVAAIKAVVEIEAGKSKAGFIEPGLPIINFDLTQFRRVARKHKINLARYQKSHAVVFARPNARKHGSYIHAQHARLAAAMQIDRRTAIFATYWGMFQIGGEQWKLCGAESPDDFVDRMSRSERDQLSLFITFLQKTGLDKHLRAHNWTAFARGYNGPGFRKHAYHTRLANAYSRYKSNPASMPDA